VPVLGEEEKKIRKYPAAPDHRLIAGSLRQKIDSYPVNG
jgi:hypothetical protein